VKPSKFEVSVSAFVETHLSVSTSKVVDSSISLVYKNTESQLFWKTNNTIGVPWEGSCIWGSSKHTYIRNKTLIMLISTCHARTLEQVITSATASTMVSSLKLMWRRQEKQIITFQAIFLINSLSH